MITLDRLLAEWLPEQRWFAAKGRQVTAVTPTAVATLRGEPRLEVRLVRVDFADGGTQTYVVPLSFRRERSDALRHALLGELEAGPDGDTAEWVYDGMQDHDQTRVWPELLAAGGRVGALAFHPEPESDIPVGLAGDVLVAEQSNTSLVYGEDAILKLFRRLESGINPDVEVHDALRPTKNPHIAPLLGYVELIEGEAVATVAMLQTFPDGRWPPRACATSTPNGTCTPTRWAGTSPARRTGWARPPRRCTPTWRRCCRPRSPARAGWPALPTR